MYAWGCAHISLLFSYIREKGVAALLFVLGRELFSFEL